MNKINRENMACTGAASSNWTLAASQEALNAVMRHLKETFTFIPETCE